jgi:formamidopyrimidine-DNA glycosylase
MPELPEVEVVRRGLEPFTVGRTVTDVEILDPRIIRRQEGGADRLRATTLGSRFTAVERRGKFLWWRMAHHDGADTGDALLAHLGMSGQLRVRTPGKAPDGLRHRRLTLTLDDGSAVDMIDQRIFGGLWTSALVTVPPGTVTAAAEGEILPADATHIAQDLLDDALDLPVLARRIRARRAPIKSLLLDQGIVSGVGNIYADEGLWAARVRYDTPGQALSQRKTLELLRETRAVMERALAVGGTSFDDLYVNVDGRSGYFARDLNVYGRSGLPCKRCGTPIVRKKFTIRSSHFCPSCQRKR